ncbi:Uncharacterized protein TC_0248 [Chlamydiales bacterium SCGC AG-110-P3]|nr:Uncharacterized protein TC_0248 [Chlamydiales bacterium SCGC AG-110-P3]
MLIRMLHSFKLSVLLLSLFIVSAPLSARAEAGDELMRSKMLSDIDTMHNLFSYRYAPVEWKEHFASWTLEEATERAKERVMTLRKPTAKEFHRILRDFCYSMKDYHVGILFCSTESAHLPFDVMSAEGRYFISYIDHSKVSSSQFPFQVGDEILYFNHTPIGQVVDELIVTEERGATQETDQRKAENILTHRLGFMGHMVPSGRIKVTGRDSDGRMHAAKLQWSYTPERIDTHYTHLEDPGSRVTMAQVLNQEEQQGELRQRFYSYAEMKNPEVEFLRKLSPESCQSAHSAGDREGFLPELGDIVWQSKGKDLFHAYISVTPAGQRIGYVRVPTYMPSKGAEKAFGNLIARFEADTDLLIFDQMNNSGGSVLYGYNLLSMLVNEATPLPKDRMKLTQKKIHSLLEDSDWFSSIKNDKEAQWYLGKYFLGVSVTYELVKQMKIFTEVMIDEWNSGKSMTEPVHNGLFGDAVYPHPTHCYSKPILCLINEQDFSMADQIPAILQDTERAVLMGTRTAGAGGSVEDDENPDLFFGVWSISYTVSIGERTNGGDPIENLGVEPDVPYSLTVEDLQNNFSPFVSAIQEQVSVMLE